MPRSSNRLLGLLLAEDLAALKPHLEHYPLRAGQNLLRPDVPVKHVYFVSEGMVSLVQLMDNGKYTETGIVGREGMVGALAPLGASAFSHEAVVQISGVSLRMSADALRIETALRPALRDILLRYVQALFSQVAQSVVCNNQHPVKKRLARWLVMGADCLESKDLRLTHELLSTMLGVRRSSVTTGLAALKAEGLIATYQGGVKIIDHPGLKTASCECYAVVRKEFRRLLGPSIFQESPMPRARRRDHNTD
jgi:CRP-like cAMP-binding protein